MIGSMDTLGFTTVTWVEPFDAVAVPLEGEVERLLREMGLTMQPLFPSMLILEESQLLMPIWKRPSFELEPSRLGYLAEPWF